MMKFQISNPGRTKWRRWLIACHEAAHARAYAVLAGVSSTLIIDRFGGLCVPHQRVNDLQVEEICIAAGDASMLWARLGGVPARRPRPVQIIRTISPSALKSDAQQLAQVSRISELEARIGERAHAIDLAEIEQAARDFIIGDWYSIVCIARALYHRGKVFVPAQKQSPGGSSANNYSPASPGRKAFP